jgi:hypothetical protein
MKSTTSRRVSILIVLLVMVAAAAFAQSGGEWGGRAERTGGVHADSVGALSIFFSGSFGYSVGGGQAHFNAQNVQNTNATATGPLRFGLYWGPNANYPTGTQVLTAQYVFTQSLAAGASLSNIDSGQVPFTDPGTGCYYVALVLEENVGGTWTMRDYGNFSLRISSGGGCLMSFTASPATISPGASSTLSWSSGGSSVTIDNGIGSRAATGSTSVSPSATTTYKITVNATADATPPTGTATVTVTQGPPPAPTIPTFTANPTAINLGSASTLTWTTTNATSVSIDNGVGSQAVNGSVNVSPSANTTYTLTATGAGGTVTKQVTVTINAPTATFAASPTTITLGNSTTLTWTTTNATSVSIDNNVGTVTASGQKVVSPTSTTTYTLTATGPGGVITRQVTVTVNSSGPGITFTASPGSIAFGSSSTLTWSTTNATSVSIDNGIGTVSSSGNQVVSPARTTIYRLTATGPGGTSFADAVVVVVPKPTATLTATPSNIPAAGQQVTLNWSTTDATSVVINNGIGAVTSFGVKNINPVATITYTLTATGVGGTTTASVTITVGVAPPAKRRSVRH